MKKKVMFNQQGQSVDGMQVNVANMTSIEGTVDTGGGAFIMGTVNMGGGSFCGGDMIFNQQGQKVKGAQINAPHVDEGEDE